MRRIPYERQKGELLPDWLERVQRDWPSTHSVERILAMLDENRAARAAAERRQKSA